MITLFLQKAFSHLEMFSAPVCVFVTTFIIIFSTREALTY
jgi:hypothetical protein